MFCAKDYSVAEQISYRSASTYFCTFAPIPTIIFIIDKRENKTASKARKTSPDTRAAERENPD